MPCMNLMSAPVYCTCDRLLASAAAITRLGCPGAPGWTIGGPGQQKNGNWELHASGLAIGYTSMATRNRWVIAAAGVVMQVALGAVYAWSVFRIPLMRTFGWTISQVTLTFTIAIFVLGLAAFAGGLWMRRSGPRTIALTAGVLYGLGV